jgi:hypothetical protein
MRDDIGAASDSYSPLPERFRIGESLGFGGTADVYRAHDRHLDRPVAVKIFGPSADPVTLRRFHDEAHALARLSHPGLVSIFDLGVHRDRPYLVMRLVDGGTLQRRLVDGPLAPPDVLRVGARLADAMAQVHERGLVHRDVKPSNILLDRDGNPFLTDFGIALLAGAARMTVTGEIVGTPAYLAPEQVLGRDIGPDVDVYALALVLLECLTGELEYSGTNKVETALARLHRPPRVPAGLPVEFASLLVTMTATDPTRRPTAQRCAERLLALHQAGVLDSWHPMVAAEQRAVRPWWLGSTGTARMRAPLTRRTALARAWRPVVAGAVATAALTAGLVMALSTPQAAATDQTTGQATAVVNSGARAVVAAPPTSTSPTAAVIARRTTEPSTTRPVARRQPVTRPVVVVRRPAPLPKPGHGDRGGKHHGGHPGPPH